MDDGAAAPHLLPPDVKNTAMNPYSPGPGLRQFVSPAGGPWAADHWCEGNLSTVGASPRGSGGRRLLFGRWLRARTRFGEQETHRSGEFGAIRWA